MKAYIIKYEDDLVAVTNDLDKWLEYNNDERKESGEEAESLSDFNIEETELCLFA